MVREQVLPVWIGEGANRKGTLRDAVMHTLGDYAIEVLSDRATFPVRLQMRSLENG